jgi:hypothetical protein
VKARKYILLAHLMVVISKGFINLCLVPRYFLWVNPRAREDFGKFQRTFTTETQRHRGILILLRVILYFSLCLCASVVKSFTHTKQRRASMVPRCSEWVRGKA